MPELTDQAYLLSEQYRNADNLNIRIEFHRRFGTETGTLQRWMFEQYLLPAQCRVLELGCGPGDLWMQNLSGLPAGWQITLSDFSAGMLAQAQENLQASGRVFGFEVIDAQAIPYGTEHFDAVIANYMLYHVPDRAKALAEICRVLKSGGHFYAMTTGRNHLFELHQWAEHFGLETMWASLTAGHGFDFEDAADEVAPHFAGLEVRRYEYPLVVTEAEPLIAYAMSMAGVGAVNDERFARFGRFIRQKLEKEGALRIARSSGMLVALKT